MSARITRPWIPTILGLGLSIAAAWAFVLYLHSPNHGLPYRIHLVPGDMRGWTAYGGTWSIAQGMMMNDSDERGAKILTGSPYWQDYSVEADLKLLGIDGNAGLMIRASDAELGIDSYRGYYSGIRVDGALTLGLADHGWSPIAEQHIYGGVHAFEWYHLRLIAYGCEIITSATPLAGTSLPASIAVYDPNCIRSGQIGLRSFSSGGVWRNVQVHPIQYEDLAEILPAIAVERLPPLNALPVPAHTYPADDSALSALPAAEAEDQPYPSNTEIRQISDLRLLSPLHPGVASVRGTVVLTKPELFIEDSTGGISILHPNGPPLKIGDEVEASGTPASGDFSSMFNEATVRLLWEREPLPPLAVTAAQAATGAFDATFIQLDGRLQSKEINPTGTSVLHVSDQDQAFRVLIANPVGDPLVEELRSHSLLRFRGICVVDSRYTHDRTPFVLLLPSTGGIDVLAGPPWWSARYLIAITVSLLLLLIIAYLLYSHMKRWRLQAVLEERERVAHEMHDTLAQSFAGIGFQLQAIRHEIKDDINDQSPAMRRQLDLACELVRHSHQEARQNISTLRPQLLETAGLLAAIRGSAERLVAGGTVEVVVTGSGDSGTLPVRISETLFRIAQEAIANAVRHSNASTISISLHHGKGVIQLTVVDNGVGFQPEEHHGGFGLEGMRKRADIVSAALHIASKPGLGTRVQVTAHLPPTLTLITFPKHAWRYFGERQRNGKPDSRENPGPYRG